jgi:hypothetical protein
MPAAWAYNGLAALHGRVYVIGGHTVPHTAGRPVVQATVLVKTLVSIGDCCFGRWSLSAIFAGRSTQCEIVRSTSVRHWHGGVGGRGLPAPAAVPNGMQRCGGGQQVHDSSQDAQRMIKNWPSVTRVHARAAQARG